MRPPRCGLKRARRWWLLFDVAGNPSSIHSEGRAARRLVEDARAAIAAATGADTRNVVFTSGGTESNMLALTPGLRRGGAPVQRLIVSAIEHASVLAGGRFPRDQIEPAPVNSSGIIDLPALAALLHEPARHAGFAHAGEQ